MFHSLFVSCFFFFSFLTRCRYLSSFRYLLIFPLWSAGSAKCTIRQVLFYLFCWLSPGLVDIWWSVGISKFLRNSGVSFSRTYSGLCIYHWFVWSNFNFLHNSQWIITLSCLVIYSFCTSLLHSWLIVLSISPHNLHLLFSCILHIFVLTYSVLMALFWTVIRRDAVTLLRFSFYRYIQVFSCDI